MYETFVSRLCNIVIFYWHINYYVQNTLASVAKSKESKDLDRLELSLYHFHTHPQFIYESFHIHYIISLLSRENMNSQLTSLPMCGFIAHLVEHRTGIAEVTGSNPVEALIFFRLQLSPYVSTNIEFDTSSSIQPTWNKI